jgi:hypothetical protein
MKISSLTNNEINYLESRLRVNKGMSDREYQSLKKNHPYAVMRDDNALILSDMKHYGLHDSDLNNFILNKFGKKEYNIDFFYELIYKTGDYTNPHLDKKTSIQTTLILLNEDFKGGELVINDKEIDFNKRGTYINFEGYKDTHSVKKVLGGERKVLVVMFNKKQTLL